MAATSVKDNSSRKHRSARGIATMQAMDTTASHVLKRGPPKLASAKDNTSSSEQSSAKGVTISHPLQRGLPNMAATSSKDKSSSKKRKAKGIKKEQASSANLEMEDDSSNKALLNFGRLLTLYQSSPTPPLLPCPWSTCNFVTQGVGEKDGIQVGAEPHIAIQLLELHVGHAHTEEDLEFLSFRVLEKLLLALPREPLPRPPDTHTDPGHQAGQQEGPMDKVGQQRKPVTIKSPSLPVEKEEGSARVSLHCHLCDFGTQVLKPSKAEQRLSSHRNSHDAKPVPPTSCHEVHRPPVAPSYPSLEAHSQSVAPPLPSLEAQGQG